MQSSSYASVLLVTPSEERPRRRKSLSTATVDLDERFSLSHLLGLADNLCTPSVDDAYSSSESVASLSESSVKSPAKQKRRRKRSEREKKRKGPCSSEGTGSPSKRVKFDNTSKNNIADVLDKRTVRRLKNNVASIRARAARKQKEHELFQEEKELRKSNAELRKQLEELEKLTAPMKKVISVEDLESLSTATVDLDELFSLSHLLGHVNNLVTPSVDDACSSSSSESESVASSSESSVKSPAEQKRRRKRSEREKRNGPCSSECTGSPSKRVTFDNASINNIADVLDKRTVRRLKNNVASIRARAARKQKEQELFQQEEELMKSNTELRKQLEELERLRATMRKVLAEKLSGVTCPV